MAVAGFLDSFIYLSHEQLQWMNSYVTGLVFMGSSWTDAGTDKDRRLGLSWARPPLYACRPVLPLPPLLSTPNLYKVPCRKVRSSCPVTLLSPTAARSSWRPTKVEKESLVGRSH